MVLAGTFSISTFLFLAWDLLGSSMPLCLAPYRAYRNLDRVVQTSPTKTTITDYSFHCSLMTKTPTPLYIKEGDTYIISLTEA